MMLLLLLLLIFHRDNSVELSRYRSETNRRLRTRLFYLHIFHFFAFFTAGFAILSSTV